MNNDVIIDLFKYNIINNTRLYIYDFWITNSIIFEYY